MSKTAAKPQTVEDLDREISAMEAELAEGYGRPLTWDEVTSATAEEMAKKERRRGILPRLKAAAKVKRLELRISQLEEELEGLNAERAERHQALEKARAAEQRAKERRQEAHNAWGTSPTASP